ncbi:MAG TPA: transglutaminase domain-containing protein [Chitinophagaceae bacterium]|nr:transglutaminase domain-containing protein [Chitinophagaceae bacterium]
MKWWPVILFLGTTIPVFSQQDKDGIQKASRKERFNETITPIALAQQLTLSCSTDLQKVRAIFYWITDNISYRTKPPRTRRKAAPVLMDDINDTAALKPLDERVAETVLEERVAVCDGYARLFKTLCSYSGIKAEVISGYARTEATKRIQRFRPNHSWNAVMIDSAWQLLDVTWAAGYITWHGNEFVRHLDEQYFLSSPEQFIREHYPDDMRWTLMADPPLMPEFRHSPFKQKSFTKYLITAYTPEKGVIEVSQGDTIVIELETASAEKDRQIMSDPFLDTTIYTTTISALLVPVQRDKKFVYTYIASMPTVQWLYILYNDDIILRYRLQIRPSEAGIANAGG